MSLLDGIARLQPSHRRTILFLGLVVIGFGLAESLRTPAAPVSEPGVEDEHAGADLKLYAAVVADVRSGKNYYDSANRHLRELGFDVGSTFNWRLPTYAWLFAAFPNFVVVRSLLLAIGLAAMLLVFGSEQATVGRWGAMAIVLLLVGVWQWGFDGDAFLAQDLWAAWLITLSLGLSSKRLHWYAVAAGLLALFLRELTLPYCLLAAGWAWRFGRRRETIAWMVGIVVFAEFLAWHASEVASRLTDADRVASTGIMGWVQFGGLQFDLLAARMNCFLFHAPGWLIYVYFVVSLGGFADRRDERGLLAGSTAAAYLLAFSIIGLPKNLYWGLMFSPLLPFGVAAAPDALRKLGKLARPARSPPVPQRSPTSISR
jgi:hypothetical protein